jgi:hypothetical protein
MDVAYIPGSVNQICRQGSSGYKFLENDLQTKIRLNGIFYLKMGDVVKEFSFFTLTGDSVNQIIFASAC